MDGTLVNSMHRYKTQVDSSGITRIDLQYWRDNEHRCLEDTALPLCVQYDIDRHDKNCYVIIATARILHDADLAWIDTILGKPDYIISRKENDNRSGALLKINGLTKFFNLKNFRCAKATFYEDNATYLKQVCDKFNIMGVYIPSQQGY